MGQRIKKWWNKDLNSFFFRIQNFALAHLVVTAFEKDQAHLSESRLQGACGPHLHSLFLSQQSSSVFYESPELALSTQAVLSKITKLPHSLLHLQPSNSLEHLQFQVIRNQKDVCGQKVYQTIGTSISGGQGVGDVKTQCEDPK